MEKPQIVKFMNTFGLFLNNYSRKQDGKNRSLVTSVFLMLYLYQSHRPMQLIDGLVGIYAFPYVLRLVTHYQIDTALVRPRAVEQRSEGMAALVRCVVHSQIRHQLVPFAVVHRLAVLIAVTRYQVFPAARKPSAYERHYIVVYRDKSVLSGSSLKYPV